MNHEVEELMGRLCAAVELLQLASDKLHECLTALLLMRAEIPPAAIVPPQKGP